MQEKLNETVMVCVAVRMASQATVYLSINCIASIIVAMKGFFDETADFLIIRLLNHQLKTGGPEEIIVSTPVYSCEYQFPV